jgi:alanine racemase
MMPKDNRTMREIDCSAFLEIDLCALADNYNSISEYVKPSLCAATIKANAYGLGLEAVSKTIYDAGCRSFFVSDLDEGIRLRENLTSPDITIYILNGLMPHSVEYYKKYNLTPVIGSLEELDEYRVFDKQNIYPIAIHFDTGFSRLGFDITLASKISEYKLNISLIMSHIASAEEKLSEMPENQLDQFLQICKIFNNPKSSIANSAALIRNKSFHLDMVRPGISLYGGYENLQSKLQVKPVVKLYAPIIQIKKIKKGATIGYGAIYKATHDKAIALVSIGYADGIPRSLSSSNDEMGGQFYYEGQPTPILGRVSMDIVAIDISDIPYNTINRGNFIEIIGSNQNIDNLSENADTISYEILTRLNSRIRKIYKYA